MVGMYHARFQVQFRPLARTPRMPRVSPHRSVPATLMLAGVTAVLCVVAYWPALRGPFVYDDIFEIEGNPAIRRFWPPWEAMRSPGGFPARPLSYYTFALNHAVHGLNPLGWHLTNLAVHLGNGLLVGLLVFRMLATARDRDSVAAAVDRADLTAWVAATLWLVHPLASQPVAYVYQRMELMAATAILAALGCFLAGRSPGMLLTTVAISAAGMLCKETAAVIPPAVLLVDWLVVSWQPDRPWRSLGAALGSRPLFYASLFATLGVAAGLVWLQRGSYRELTTPVWTPLAYALTQPSVILHYLRLAVAPVGQCFDYGWPAERSIAAALPGLAAVGGAIMAAVWSVPRRPLAACAILLFFLLLAPSSSLVPVNDICVEHRAYLPLAVVVAAASAAVTTTLKPAPPVLIAGALVLAAVLAGITAARTTIYGSLLDLWTDTAAKAPHNQRALLWVGIALDEAGRQNDAFAAFGRTIAADPDNRACARAHTFRAALLGRRGDLTSAVAEARRAVALDPDDGLGWVNLARGLYERGQLPEAEEAGRRSVDRCRGGERLVAMVNLARILADTGRSSEAVSLCAATLAADPAHEPARRLLADLAPRGD